jgi:predicted RecB family nuclease
LQSIEDFIAKYFVDLLPIAQEVAFPVTGYSIKVLAPEAKFKWRVDDAGGGNSIVYFQKATSSTASQADKDAAISWLRSYNEDDVRATFAVRAYLRELARGFEK